MKLPEDFIFKTRSFITKNNLPLDGFFESFDEEPLRGIRLNMSKVAPSDYESVMADLGESVDKVTWCDSNMKGQKKDGIRYALIQWDAVKDIDWFVDAFCRKKYGATIYRLRDDIIPAE